VRVLYVPGADCIGAPAFCREIDDRVHATQTFQPGCGWNLAKTLRTDRGANWLM